MKNANIEDVMMAQPNSVYIPPTNIVFLVAHPQFEYPIKAHIKRHIWNDSKIYEGLLIEDMNGFKFVAEAEWLRPVPRKLGTPAKPKRKPVKGVKPWLANYVTYDPSLIKVNGRVLCRDGEVRIVSRVTEYGLIDFDGYKSAVYLKNGKAMSNDVTHGIDIVKVFVHPADKQLNEPKQQRNTAMKQAHDVAYGGYEVGKWHFWDGKTNSPPVGKGVAVLVWFREEKSPEKQPVDAAFWCWKWDNCGSDIIAFKITD